ncbi:hypothetical protein PSHT_08673 [Puccinia striiformis]|uniref:Gluconate 5-dehydrogenase n=1 Tax=Puccinia striiformis TaxID=27350 RepID=A0A2S4VM55_9BASI|nr:hypothetical protein PSHT_08673 [Puccinia striiformis]
MEATDAKSNPLLIGNLFGIKGRIAVITGGGAGLGEMMASAWVVNGGHVVIAARKEEILSKTCERLNRLGTGKAEYIVSDLSSKAGCVALCEEVKKKFDKIHVLVNNSGMAIAGEYHQYPEKDWDDVFNLNVKSIFYMTAELTPLLAKDATNLDPEESSSSLRYRPLTTTASLETMESGRGLFPSGMTQDILDNADQVAKDKCPMGRYGAVEDMAGIFLFLASRAGAHISANAILTDGGATAAGKVPHDVVS